MANNELTYILNVKGPQGQLLSIPFDDPEREQIIIDSVKRILRFRKGEIDYFELDEDTLAHEVLAICNLQ